MTSATRTLVAIAGAVVLAVGLCACGKPQSAPGTTAAGADASTNAPAAESLTAAHPHPRECATARSADECAEILRRMDMDPAAAYGTPGNEPVYSPVSEIELPPCKSGAANCESWERMWPQ